MSETTPKQVITHKTSFYGSILRLIVDHYTFLFLFFTLLSFGYKVVMNQERWIESFLLSFLTWSVGVRGLVAFLANWIPFSANQISASYGWSKDSSFQREIAAADGAFGILGILCNWYSGNFWIATIIAVSFCWFFSELGGLIKMAKRREDPSYKLNTSLQRGMRLDLIFSLALPLFLFLWKKGF